MNIVSTYTDEFNTSFENVNLTSDKKTYDLSYGYGFGKNPVITDDMFKNGTTQVYFNVTDLTGLDRIIDIEVRIENATAKEIVIEDIWNWSLDIPHYEQVINWTNTTVDCGEWYFLKPDNTTCYVLISNTYENLTHYGPGWNLINESSTITDIKEKDKKSKDIDNQTKEDLKKAKDDAHNKTLTKSTGKNGEEFYNGASIYSIYLKANSTEKFKFNVKGSTAKNVEFLIEVYESDNPSNPKKNQLVGLLDPDLVELSDAIHLDSNRDPINNIYDEVKTLDNVWSEPIYTNEFVRVNFSLKLDNTRDITVYARNNDSYNIYLELYTYNSSAAFAQSSLINEEGYYKTLLTNLTGLHSEFDIKIVSSQNTFLEFNYIVDPSVPTHTTPILNSTNEANPTTANLTVYNQSTSDADGNSMTNIIDWRLNGSSFAVLNMPFDTNRTGQTGSVIRDYSLNVNNGTLNGGPVWNASGKRGGAYVFDGVNDYINTTYNASDIGIGAVTISFWMKPIGWEGLTGDIGYMAVLSNSVYTRGANNGWDGCHFSRILANWVDSNVDGELVMVCGGALNPDNEISHAVHSTFALSNNVWYHVVGVKNSTKNALYIDGILKDTANSSSDLVNTNDTYLIGRHPDATYQRYFNGTIDDVRIYNKALTLKEIQMLYNNKTNMIDSGTTTTAENWSACITPNDATGDGSTLCSSNLTIGTDSTAPKFYDAINATSISTGNNITMNISIEDGIRLVNYTFSWNDTGSWANDTAFQIGDVTTWNANTSKSITASVNTVVSWRYYARDNSSNYAASGLYNFTVAASVATEGEIELLNANFLDSEQPISNEAKALEEQKIALITRIWYFLRNLFISIIQGVF